MERFAVVDSAAMRATEKHCEVCFDALIWEFKRKDVATPFSFPDVSCGVFVTWDKLNEDSGRYAMRGCIGSLQPRPLHDSIKEFSLKSAFEDRRFDPIWEEEIPFLSCSVSLLFQFETAKDWQDWEIGVHGLVIRFYDEHARSHASATYLPYVAVENRWSHEETVRKLIRKSGYQALITADLLSRVSVTRYRSTLASLTYEEYIKRKNGYDDC